VSSSSSILSSSGTGSSCFFSYVISICLFSGTTVSMIDGSATI
jgi:hypothetical protein